MPLLTSPIDGAPMRQIHRFGIEFDVCPSSGGVWLDKGELEKLLAFIKEETALEADDRGPRLRNRDDDYDDGSRGGGRRTSRLKTLFDF